MLFYFSAIIIYTAEMFPVILLFFFATSVLGAVNEADVRLKEASLLKAQCFGHFGDCVVQTLSNSSAKSPRLPNRTEDCFTQAKCFPTNVTHPINFYPTNVTHCLNNLIQECMTKSGNDGYAYGGYYSPPPAGMCKNGNASEFETCIKNELETKTAFCNAKNICLANLTNISCKTIVWKETEYIEKRCSCLYHVDYNKCFPPATPRPKRFVDGNKGEEYFRNFEFLEFFKTSKMLCKDVCFGKNN